MIGYEIARDGMLTVRFADKVLCFRRQDLPADWETLFRDPEICECVNQTVLDQGGPAADGAGAPPVVGWDAVQHRLERLQGTTG